MLPSIILGSMLYCWKQFEKTARGNGRELLEFIQSPQTYKSGARDLTLAWVYPLPRKTFSTLKEPCCLRRSKSWEKNRYSSCFGQSTCQILPALPTFKASFEFSFLVLKSEVDWSRLSSSGTRLVSIQVVGQSHRASIFRIHAQRGKSAILHPKVNGQLSTLLRFLHLQVSVPRP